MRVQVSLVIRAAFLLILAALPAMAQQSSIDPRLAGPAVTAMQAEVALREAIIKVLQEDATKREQEWKDWFKAWCEATPGCAPVKLGESK